MTPSIPPPRRPRAPTARALLSAFALAGFGIVAALAMIALLIRLFPALEPGGQRFVFTEYDGDTFRHQPGLVRPPAENRVLEDLVRHDDADGFRRPAMTAARYPIAAIGDSFTDGGQTPWVDVLAAALDTPVRNLGWSGFGPLEYAAVAERYLTGDEDWALVMFFEGNDLSNTRTAFQRAEAEGGLALDLTRAVASPILELRSLAQYTDITLNADDWYLYPLTHPRPDGTAYALAYLSDYLWWLNGDPQTYAESRELAELRRALEAIVAAADGACVGLVYAPSKEHIYFPHSDPGGNRRYVMENGLALTLGADGWLTFDGPRPQDDATVMARLNNQRDAVRDAVQAAGIQFIDLVPAFEAAAEAGDLAYYAYDSHWNARGHQLAGETVAAHLRANPCP